MAGSEPPMSPNLKPIATRPRGGDVEAGGHSPPSSSGIITPKGRNDANSDADSPTMGSDSSSPWRRFFRGASKYPASDLDSFGNSPRNLMGFSPRAGSSASARWAYTQHMHMLGPAQHHSLPGYCVGSSACAAHDAGTPAPQHAGSFLHAHAHCPAALLQETSSAPT
jgi:hypothetical protein